MATDNASLGNRIVAGGLLIQRLLEHATLVGGVYTMGYDECLVLTNDLWKRRCGGIPQHCFLLAAAMVSGSAPEPEDEEVILLRVIGPAPLPAEAELVQVRSEAMREIVVSGGTQTAASSRAILDVLTRNEIQFSGIKVKVLGTFYDADVAGRHMLAFGSDVDSFYSASRYKVYKPYGASLEMIASYPEVTEAEERVRQERAVQPARIRIGEIRYSSTGRRRTMAAGGEGDTAVAVRVNIDDFVSMKTAVFGMTRLGKSNTMKTIATAVCQHAAETNQRIGQLLFDPAGEYANVNVQDQTALAQIGADHVTIFRLGASGTEPGIRSLSTNFFSDNTIEVTCSIVRSALAHREADYVKSFLSADIIGPEDLATDPSAFKRAQRRRAAFYACLRKASFNPPPSFVAWVPANRDVLSLVNQHRPDRASAEFAADAHGMLSLRGDDLVRFWDCVIVAKEASPGNQHLERWIDSQLDAILTVYAGSVGSGFRILEPLRVFHSPARDRDYAQEVLDELIQGKIVIVDLSLGSETVLQFCSERIVNHILTDASRRFASGQEPHKIQIFIEEAHRLFNRDKMKAPEEADPYVRLAKEAAKFRIGLIYATQEVSSVDPMILANTSNWMVTHLNNHVEVKELSKYYDFQDFAELTLKAEDVGFARIKMRSGRYIIPAQIDLFDRARIEAAAQAAQGRGSQTVANTGAQ